MIRRKSGPNPVFPEGGVRVRILRSMWQGWSHWSVILAELNAVDEGSRKVSASVMRATATKMGLRRPYGRGRYQRQVEAQRLGIEL